MYVLIDLCNFGFVFYDFIEGKVFLWVSFLYFGIFFFSFIVVMKYIIRKFFVCFFRFGYYDVLGYWGDDYVWVVLVVFGVRCVKRLLFYWFCCVVVYIYLCYYLNFDKIIEVG